MTESDSKKTAAPDVAERTGKQDLAQALSSGIYGLPWGASYTTGLITSGGAFSVGGVGGGLPMAGGLSQWAYGPLMATQGSGTLDGTNKYSPPTLLPGGAVGMLPGQSQPWPGTYATYRVMAAHPTIVLAMAAVMAPIAAGEWSVVEDKNAPSGAKEMIEEIFLKRRTKMVQEKLKALIFGWRGFELVRGWKTINNGRYYATIRNKALLPELTDIQTDARGHFAGLRQGATLLDGNSSSVYTYDKDGDYYYGRPRMENCRRTWSNWLSVEDNKYKLGTKTASIIPQVGYPPGDGKDADGRVCSHYQVGADIARGMSQGRPVVYPNFGNLAAGNLEDLLRSLPDIAKASLWHFGTIDMGNAGPALMAMIEDLKYMDMLLVRGWLQPERSLLESRHGGSRADSEGHGDNATNDADAVHEDIVSQTNEQEVDADLVANFGEEARGAVRIEAVPLIDAKKILDDKLLDGILNNPQALAELIAHLDMDAWIDRSGLPKKDDAVDDDWDGMFMPQPAESGTSPPRGNDSDLLPARSRVEPDPPIKLSSEDGDGLEAGEREEKRSQRHAELIGAITAVANKQQPINIHNNIPKDLNIPAPIVNIPAPIVHVAAPVVNVAEQPATIVNIPAPIVNVAAPVVNIPKPGPMKHRVVRDNNDIVTHTIDEPV